MDIACIEIAQEQEYIIRMTPVEAELLAEAMAYPSGSSKVIDDFLNHLRTLVYGKQGYERN